MAPLLFFHPSIPPHLDKLVTFFFAPSTNTYERRIKMKSIGKIIIVAFLAMFLVSWASPSEAINGRARFSQSNHYKNGHKKNYKIGHRNHRVHGYNHYYPRHRYSHYRSHYKPNYYRHGHYSHLGLHLSPHGTRVHIRLGF